MSVQVPIQVTHLFAPERAALLELLRGLDGDDWSTPTACAGWTVKDVALHVLGGDVGLVARKRDDFAVTLPEADAFVAALNLHNELWVEGTRRMSPAQVIDLLDHVGGQAIAVLEGLDLHALGGPVYWAGPDPAPVWLDVAREYTERWHHQQHIRDAVGRPGLLDRTFAAPVFEAFVQALPWSFRDVAAEPGTTLQLRVRGEAGGRWQLTQRAGGWSLDQPRAAAPTAAVEMSPDMAWKMFTDGLPLDECERAATIAGDASLARALFTTRAIIV